MRENSVILMEDDYFQKYEGFDPASTESYIMFEFLQNKHMEQSISFASEIQNSFVRAKRSSRGVRQGGLLVLRKTSMPGVLIELGFISNRTEERFMASAGGQHTLAQAIYRAFDVYKKDYDRKVGYIKDRQVITEPAAIHASSADTDNGNTEIMTDDRTGDVIYKVQILTSDKKLSVKDKRFKGYDDISFYIDKGIYKYTYGATSDYKKILNMHKKAVKDFKGAFIIKMKNEKRVYN
jgi:N-acetylmuramoyl-L-alanine amidase